MRASLERTQSLLSQGTEVLYEAALQYDGVLAYVDMLVRGGEGWRLYEVKSTTSVKEVHVPDAGIQTYILRGAGLPIDDVSIVHLNNQYVRQGDLDPHQLFAVTSVWPQVESQLQEIESQVGELKDVLRGGAVPQIDIGPHCFDPYDCDFIDHCWREIPEVSVFNVARMKKAQAFELYREGIVRIEDIPEDFPLSESSRFHVENHKRGQPLIDKDAIRGFLDTLSYPLYFLDFETYNPAIPPFDGTRPYGHIPFQYSLHRKEASSAEPHHVGFLAEAGSDPRRPLVESLLKDTADPGEILVYYQPFESKRISELAEQLPEYRSGLEHMLSRLRDLIVPFQRHHYYHPHQQGSNSIKAVLPAIVPDLTYGDLAITDGGLAMLAYSELHGEKNPRRIEQIRKNLWEYCERDTYAMVRILEALEGTFEASS